VMNPSPRREHKDGSEDRVKAILEACKRVVEQGEDPFTIDVREALQTLGQLLPKWDKIHQLLLDAAAIEALSHVVSLQAERLAQEATSLQVDPTLIAEKVRNAQVEAIAAAFLASWRRIAQLEYLSEQRLQEAVAYYLELKPLRQRFFRLGAPPRIRPPKMDSDELRRLRIILDVEFRKAVADLYAQLQAHSDRGVEYYEFVRGRDWEESLFRAYVTAHLLTTNLASLEYDPLKDILMLKPAAGESREAPRSFAIPLDLKRLMG
jgi:hypothetical protein